MLFCLFIYIISLSGCITSSNVCLGVLMLQHKLMCFGCGCYLLLSRDQQIFVLARYLSVFRQDVFDQILSHFQERKRLDLYNTQFRNKNCFRKKQLRACFYFEFVCCFCLNKLPAMHVVN